MTAQAEAPAPEVPAPGQNWYEATRAAGRGRERLAYDLDVDVCVIGGGFAGLTTARELARRGWAVAVLEAGRIGGQASGRNCGFVLPGFGESMGRIVERIGIDDARALWALAEGGRRYVRDTIRETKMPGVDAVDAGWLWVAKFAEDAERAAEVALLCERFDAAVELWPAEQVRAVLRTPLYYNAAYDPTSFHIHPLNYALGLADAAEQAGARIFEATPALAIDPAGVRKRITTPSARVRAAQIVLAANATLGALQPRLAATLMPVTTFIAVTAPLDERLQQTIAYRGAVSDTERADNHYRIVDGNRLMWSGGMRAWQADPRRLARRLRADIHRLFPQLGTVEIEYVWSGTLGRTVHRMPQVGLLAPGLWVASGFGGHGLNTTAMAGQLIAAAIAENDSRWRLLQPYELVWAGGFGGRVFMQARYAVTRLRERGQALAANLHGRGPLPPLPQSAMMSTKGRSAPQPPAAARTEDGRTRSSKRRKGRPQKPAPGRA